MTTTLTETTTGTRTAATLLGVSYGTAHRMALRLGHTGLGSGHRIRLTGTEMRICRAWLAISNSTRSAAENRRIEDLVAAALRAHPARWLVLVEGAAVTTHYWEDAVHLAAAAHHPLMSWLIDCDQPA